MNIFCQSCGAENPHFVAEKLRGNYGWRPVKQAGICDECAATMPSPFFMNLWLNTSALEKAFRMEMRRLESLRACWWGCRKGPQAGSLRH